MKVRHTTSGVDKVALDMTPMIDCVFQLLIFFIMSLKIVTPEGDFNVSLPVAAAADSQQDEPPLKLITLVADGGGNLADIRYEGRSFGQNWPAVQRELIRYVGGDAGEGTRRATTEVEINAPPELQYMHVVHGLNFINGEIVDGQVVKLIDHVRFTPRRPTNSE